MPHTECIIFCRQLLYIMGFFLSLYSRVMDTSVIQRHWAAQRNEVYKQQYQQLQDDTNLKYKINPLSKIVIHTSAHPYCTEVWMTSLESGWNLWVWLVGVVSRRWVWLVGGTFVIRRYIDILNSVQSDRTTQQCIYTALSYIYTVR